MFTFPREPIWIWSIVVAANVSRKKSAKPTHSTGLRSWWRHSKAATGRKSEGDFMTSPRLQAACCTGGCARSRCSVAK